ncbi:MAG: hypothetical protein ACYSVY_08540 [Planctomycetota bacterium]
MRITQGVSAAIGLVSLACLGMAAAPDQTAVSNVPGFDGARYALFVDSIFAQGCMGSGGGHHGCMCPLQPALEFTGGFTLTPNPRVPPGHRAYDVTVEDWLVTFDEEPMEITGDGYYDTWTDLQGDRWQSMTLDLYIYDEGVHLFSGVVEGAVPEGEFPEEIHISLESDTVCFGYVILLEAERVPVVAAQSDTDDSAEVDTREPTDSER